MSLSAEVEAYVCVPEWYESNRAGVCLPECISLSAEVEAYVCVPEWYKSNCAGVCSPECISLSAEVEAYVCVSEWYESNRAGVCLPECMGLSAEVEAYVCLPEFTSVIAQTYVYLSVWAWVRRRMFAWVYKPKCGSGGICTFAWMYKPNRAGVCLPECTSVIVQAYVCLNVQA
jgi:hypothetical protein